MEQSIFTNCFFITLKRFVLTEIDGSANVTCFQTTKEERSYMEYKWYSSDIDEVWKYQLGHIYYKIQEFVHKHTNHWLKVPNFAINYDLNINWGEWHKDSRTIVFSGKLLRNYEAAAVEYVMRHEVAHQIVDEIFDIEGLPHGEAWERACKIVDIEANRCASSDFLIGFQGRFSSNLIEKIRKLIIHGNDNAVTREESELFLTKAQELMIRHNIDMRVLNGGEGKRFYIKRPVGPLMARKNSWVGGMATLVSNYYDVRCIYTYCNNKRRIEFFGDPSNLDIAEYIFHALLNQGEYLWEEYKNNHQAKVKNDETYRQNIGVYNNKLYSRISKSAFMAGLISGYEAKLSMEKSIILDKIDKEDKAIILSSDGMLDEAYEKQYNPSKGQRYTTRGQGYSAGYVAGSKLSLSQGVRGGSTRGLMISA